MDGEVQPGEYLAVADSMEGALGALPPGLVKMERSRTMTPSLKRFGFSVPKYSFYLEKSALQ